MAIFLLSFSNLLLCVAVIAYFYFREVKQKNDGRDDIEKLHNFYKEGIASCKSIYESKDDLIRESFTAYLKHIQSLEKMALPKQPVPITKEMVENIMFNSSPPIPNDIEKDEDQKAMEDFNEILNNIPPLSSNTKVAFEEDLSVGSGLEEEIIV